MKRFAFFVGLFFMSSSTTLTNCDRNGVNINALPGTKFQNGFVINSENTKNSTGPNQVVEAQNVTVKTPIISVQFSNNSEHAASNSENILAKANDLVSLLPSSQDLDDTTIDLSVPVKVSELVDLASASSPAQFRQKIYGSPFLENVLSDIEEKSKYFTEMKSLLDHSPSHIIAPKSIVKRQAVWSEPSPHSTSSTSIPVPDLIQLVHQPRFQLNHKMVHDNPKFSDFVYSSQAMHKRSLKHDGIDNREESIRNGYQPESRALHLPRLPHLLPLHRIRRPIPPLVYVPRGARVHTLSSHQPLLVALPLIIPTPANIEPIIRSLVNPQVIQSFSSLISHSIPVNNQTADLHHESETPNPESPQLSSSNTQEHQSLPIITSNQPQFDSVQFFAINDVGPQINKNTFAAEPEYSDNIMQNI